MSILIFVDTLSIFWETGRMLRIPKREFEQIPLHVHDVLAGLPIHDVWAVDLVHWRSDITLREFLDTTPLHAIPTSLLTRALLRLRSSIGRLLGWDTTTRREQKQPLSESGADQDSTFKSQISDTDQQKCLIEPGSVKKGLQAVYSFTNEHIFELTNKTVHAALAVVLVEKEHAYRLYLGVLVANVGWWTPYYMAAIAPFRRWIVYPSLLRGIHTRWNEVFGPSPQVP
jgi:hypothetical protein